jgi:hypothetical protein
MADDDEPSWKVDYLKRLNDQAQEAKKAREEWQRRWFLSLTFGNGAGVAAVASAAFNIAPSISTDFDKGRLFEVLLVAGWLFAVGLVAGGLLPFLWAKKVEKIPTLTYMREIEIDSGPQMVGDPEDGVVSSDLISDAVKHEKLWSRCFNISAIVSTSAFLLALLWLLTSATVWVLR